MSTEHAAQMFGPPHPGEFIAETYLEPFGLSARVLAGKLEVSPSTLTRVLNGSSRVTPEMALRLSRVLGRSAESWLSMQDSHDLWEARARLDIQCLTRVDFSGTTDVEAAIA